MRGRRQENTPAEEVALSNNEPCPLMEGCVSSDPGGTGNSQQATFVQVDGEKLVLLPPPPTHTLSRTEEEGNLPTPEPVAPTSRPKGSQVVGAHNVRSLYKRTLELDIEHKKLDIEYKTLLIKKVKLEVEKLEYEKKEREN